jgi:hypothetical protein
MDWIRFIYNKIRLDGGFVAIYCDTTVNNMTSNNNFLRIIKNGKRSIVNLTTEHQKELFEIISQFIDGGMGYQYDEKSKIENELLVSIGGLNESVRVEYYYWKEKEDIPKGVEILLEYFDKVLKVNSL